MIFLMIIALIWILAASVQDIKKREVPNWINFSLIAIGLSYRVFYSLISSDINFFLQGLIGFGIFFVLGYVFYYGRVFAGGDAKLLMGLGAFLGFSAEFIMNIWIYLGFIFLLLLCGSVYGLIYSFSLAIKRRKEFIKEFKKQFKKNILLFVVSFIAAILVFLAFIFTLESIILLIVALFIIFPFLYNYAKAIEESCMIREVETTNLVEGDWLYRKVKVGKKMIMPNWQGLSSEELKVLRKRKMKVLVKEGIPFVPAFLFAFIILVYLWYSSWQPVLFF